MLNAITTARVYLSGYRFSEIPVFYLRRDKPSWTGSNVHTERSSLAEIFSAKSLITSASVLFILVLKDHPLIKPSVRKAPLHFWNRWGLSCSKPFSPWPIFSTKCLGCSRSSFAFTPQKMGNTIRPHFFWHSRIFTSSLRHHGEERKF